MSPRILCLLFLIFNYVYGQTAYFISPPAPGPEHDYTQNTVYINGSTQLLQWNTNYEHVNLKIYQNDNENYYVIFPNQVGGFGTYNWTASFVNLDPRLPNIFYFRMNSVEDDSQTFSSHYFNITRQMAVSNPVMGSVAATTTATASPSADTTSSMVQSAATAATVSSSTSTSELSSSAKAGIGVGVSCGALAIIGLGALVLWYRRKAKYQQATASSQHELTQRSNRDEKSATSWEPLPAYREAPVEAAGRQIDNSRSPQELAG